MTIRARDAAALERFENRTATPMFLLSILLVPVLVLPYVFDLSPGTEDLLQVSGALIWAVFFLEYLKRLSLAPDRRTFVWSNKVDLIVIVLPFLRPLRVIRTARSLQALRAGKAVASFGHLLRALKTTFGSHKLNYAVATVTLLTFFCALMVEGLEKHAEDANITSTGDALWWAATTVTTVGYGDMYPVTTGGRLVGTVLMILGVGLFGLLAGSLASSFLGSSTDENEIAERRPPEGKS